MLVAYAQHIKQLCEQHRLTVYGLQDSLTAHVNIKTRVANIAVPRTLFDYMTALHEIGHAVGEGALGIGWSFEVAAERWAMANAKYPPDADTLQQMGECLQSYDTSKSVNECIAIIKGEA